MKLVTILQAGALFVLALYGAAAAKSADAPAPCVADRHHVICEQR